MLEIRNLTKSFGDRTAVGGFTFDVAKGECFGLLGPSGAGKTTLLKMLSGALKPQEGELFLLGLSMTSSLREIKSRIGVASQEHGLDLDLTAFENLLVYSRYFGLTRNAAEDRIRELMKVVKMDDRLHQVAESLTFPHQKRLALVRALLNDPDLLILDEPASLLNTQARSWTWDFIRRQKQEGRTLLLTTQDRVEAETVCDRVGLVHKGRLLVVGSPMDLIREHWGNKVVELTTTESERSYFLNRLKERKMDHHVFGSRILFRLQSETELDPMKSFHSSSLTVRKPDLNDVFLKLTDVDLREERQA